MVDMLADSVEKEGTETPGETLRDVEYRALVDTLADNLKQGPRCTATN